MCQSDKISVSFDVGGTISTYWGRPTHMVAWHAWNLIVKQVRAGQSSLGTFKELVNKHSSIELSGSQG